MRQELNASWKWQPGCSVRLLRSDESLNDKWLDVEESPVRAGLVKHCEEDWAYRYEFNNPNNCRATAWSPTVTPTSAPWHAIALAKVAACRPQDRPLHPETLTQVQLP